MGNVTVSIESDSKMNEESESSKREAIDPPRMVWLGFESLPVALLDKVGDYLTDEKNDPVRCALVGEQIFTLCLSHDCDPKFALCWETGSLSSEHQWTKFNNARHRKMFRVNDHEGCLRFLARRSLIYCRIVIDVLIVKLNMATRDAHNALNDLRCTLKALEKHLSSVKHVVIAISEYDTFSFFLRDTIGKETGMPLPNSHQQELLQIIDDLDTCMSSSQMLNVDKLFAFYFKSRVKPASEVFLDKCTILVNHEHGQSLFKKEASHNLSKKIMWVYDGERRPNLFLIDQRTSSLCHAVRFNEEFLRNEAMVEFGTRRMSAFNYQDNPFVERIVITSFLNGGALKLPQPVKYLPGASPFSALIEINLSGSVNSLHLTQLNSGYFPHLQHLSVTYATITGHLNSHRVPSLKTLIIEPGMKHEHCPSHVYSLIRERIQLLLHSGRPWQLAVARHHPGWSMASYDSPIPNPQEDIKEDSIHTPRFSPYIKELLLVALSAMDMNEWQMQLNGAIPPKTMVDNHDNSLLVWSPNRVQKLTAISTLKTDFFIDFEKILPGERRSLSALECHRVNVVLHGAALPNLQSLEVNDGDVKMKSCFPQLQSLSLKDVNFLSRWLLDAPELQSLFCHRMRSGRNLSLNPVFLPHLSSLQITSSGGVAPCCPEIFLYQTNAVGFSRFKQVVLDKEFTSSPYFEQFQLHRVPHLELHVNYSCLPKSWHRTAWQCETLKIHIFGEPIRENVPESKKKEIFQLPSLPRVKELTVTSENSPVSLNRRMPTLTDCTIQSPAMFGPRLRCRALKSIRFTESLPKSDFFKALNPDTYKYMFAQPEWIYIDCSNEKYVNHVTWKYSLTWENIVTSPWFVFFFMLILYVCLPEEYREHVDYALSSM